MREEFLTTRQGKQFVLFEGLLDEAHNRGLRSINTEILQVPNPENGNVAVCKATVEMQDGRAFSGIGDASPENVGRTIAPHVLRMAETRAKARALRDAINVGATAFEELTDGGGPDVEAEAPPAASAGRGQRPRARSGGRSSGEGSGDGGRGASGLRAVRAVENPSPPPGAPEESGRHRTSGSRAGQQEARKSQIDLLTTRAVELRGERGVEKLETRIGKPLNDLTQAEADEWVDRLTPSEDAEAAR